MAENEPRTVNIDPKVQASEQQALINFLTTRNLILAQALEDASVGLNNVSAECERLRGVVEALHAPQVLDGEP